MGEIIAMAILVGSILGMGIIIFRKIPTLLTLPEVEVSAKESVASMLKRKFNQYRPFKNLSLDSFLQKLLYKIRLLALKTDVKTWHWLQRLREKSQKKKLEEDNYWDEIKKSIKEK